MMARKSKTGARGHAHNIWCLANGCSQKKRTSGGGQRNDQVPEEYMRPGWSRGANWSRSQRDQFPQGVPDEGEG